MAEAAQTVEEKQDQKPEPTQQDPQKQAQDVEFAEEMTGFMVDVQGDEDYEHTTNHDANGDIVKLGWGLSDV